MTLTDLASLGSFVSGLAVLASLVFLFFQMRQMTEQVRQAERNQQSLIQQGRTARFLTTMLARTEPHLSSALAHLDEGISMLTPAELIATRAWLNAVIMGFEDSFRQFQAGTLPAASWESDVTTLRVIAAWPVARTEWALIRGRSAGEYRDYVDNLIRDTPVDTQIANADSSWRARYEQEVAT
jgi:hypothetical protein